MSQIQTIYAPSVEKQLKSVYQDLDLHHKKLVELSKLSIDFYGGKSASNPKEFKDAVTQIESLNKKIKEQQVLIEKLNASKQKIDEKTRLSEIRLQQAREQAFDRYEKQLQRQSQTQQKTAEQSQRNAEKEGQARLRLNIVNERANRAYNLLNENHRRASERLQDLIARGRQAGQTQRGYNREIERASQDFQRLNQRVLQADQAVGRFNRNVGNYPQLFNRARTSFMSFIGAFGLVGGVFMFASAIKSAFNSIKEFDRANTDLAATMGKTKSEIKELTKDAVRLGGATKFTATEVSGLQKEFAKFGFSKREILDATEATLNLAAATGEDLAKSAMVAAQTLRGFGLDASEMGRVTDVMASSFTKSALDLENFTESMKYVAPIAKTAGVSIEFATGMLGKLADAGIKGSMAGTSLRRILTEMAKTGLPASEAFDKIAKSGISVTDAMDDVGRTAQTALIVLSENKDAVLELSDAFDRAGGSAERMADEQLQSLDGRITLMTSAWDGFVQSLNKGDGLLSNFFKKAADQVTGFIEYLQDFNTTESEILDGIYQKSYNATKKSIEGKKAMSKQAHLEEMSYSMASVSNLISQIEYMEEWNKSLAKEISLRKESGMSFKELYKKNKLLNHNKEQVFELNKHLQEQKGRYEALLDPFKKVTEETAKNTATTESATKAKKERIKVNYDSAESEIALKIAILERQKAEANERMNNKDLDYSIRLKASEDFYEKELQLLNEYSRLEKESLTRKNNEAVEKNRVAFANKNITQEEYNSNVLELDKILKNELETSEIKFSQDLSDIVSRRFQFIRQFNEEERKEILESEKIANEAEKSKYSQVFKNDNLTRKSRLEAHKAYIELVKKELQAQKILDLAAASSPQERLNIAERYRQELILLDEVAQTTQLSFKTIFQQIGSELQSSLSTTFDFVDTLFQNQISRYDELIEKSNEYYDGLIANAEAGSAQEIALQEEKAAAEKRLQEQKRQAEIKAFRFKQMASVAEIAMQTAIRIMEIPIALQPILTPLVIAQGAIQTATVLAQRPPAYAEGTDFHKGGDAIVGDGGKREIVQTPDGSLYETPDTTTLFKNMPRGSKVYPDADIFFRNMLKLNFKQKDESANIEKAIEKGFKKAKINNFVKMPKIDLGHEFYKQKGL